MNLWTPSAELPLQAPLPDGSVLDCAGWGGRWPTDCSQYLDLPHGGRVLRVHAVGPEWLAEIGLQLAARQGAPLEVLPRLQVVPLAGGVLVLREKGPTISLRPSDDPLEVLAACRILGQAIASLHKAGLLWLCFHPDALEEGPRIGNLDLGLHFQGAPPEGLTVSPVWSSPETWTLDRDRLGPASDVWSLAMFAYHRFACLKDGFPGMGPAAFGFYLPPLRVYAPYLPPGIEPVLRRALHPDARQRTSRVEEFLDQFADAVDRAEHREAWKGGIRVVTQSATRQGHVHALKGQPNQDSHALLPLEDGLAAIVCDGVTHALIGSGDLASRTAIDSLTASLPGLVQGARVLEDRAVALVQAFEIAGRAVLDRAMREPLGRLASDPSDLMCTTAVVGLLSGRELLLATAGDSRAYLVRDGKAEQLTVDGDVRCVSLALSRPPEEVLELGPTSQALYNCLGVGMCTPEGMIHDDERCIPTLFRLFLLPGDEVILCTDGLVEEGLFLSPEDLPGLRGADAMIEAAWALRGDPTPEEPEGRGDDVTCIVLMVKDVSLPE